MTAPRLRRGAQLLLVVLLLAAGGAFAARAGASTTRPGSPRLAPTVPQLTGGVPQLTGGVPQLTVTRTPSVTTVTKTVTSTAAAGTPVLVSGRSTRPAGYRLTAGQALAIASRDPRVRAELRRHPRLEPFEYTKGAPEWQVSWFTRGSPQREFLQVYVDDGTERVTQAWTGYQVAWSMARGYHGAFGRIVNAWYIWIPFCLVFVAPFLPWRRRPTLVHLDLLVLLGFSISLALFNHARIGLSVPLVYPFLIYLLVRLTLLGFRRGVPRGPLRLNVPVSWLIIAVVFLMAFRIALNVLDSNVIDVGYAGVIGADKLVHGVKLYGHWPADNLYGDTYGPVNYYLYVPFRLIFGWSGTWNSLPAAHGAAIFFDVTTLAALFWLGRRLGGDRLGAVLAFAWAADPFTLWTLSSNTNDSLVALLGTLALLAITSPTGRGVATALGGLVKFAPFALFPLFLRGTERRLSLRAGSVMVAAFAVTVVVCMLPVLLRHNLGPFWHDSIRYQADRVTPFSVWGLWGGLRWLQHLLEGIVVVGAVAVALWPDQRGPAQVAALAGAVTIALQIVGAYWLYSYIVWWLPFALVAIFASHPEPGDHLTAAWRELEDRPIEPLPVPVPVRVLSVR